MKTERDREVEERFVEACRTLWEDINIPWGYHLNKKSFPIYSDLLERFHTQAFTEEIETEARMLWQIANSPLAKALNEEE